MATFSDNLLEMAAQVIDAANEHGVKVSTAESCTGGLISGALTAVAGSSSVVMGGIVSYAVPVKQSVLGVSAQTLETFGVVSEEVAFEMACGACKITNSDFAVSTTGIAGPGGAEPGKPVGTVCLCVAKGGAKFESRTIHATGNRDEVRLQAVSTALEMLFLAINS